MILNYTETRFPDEANWSEVEWTEAHAAASEALKTDVERRITGPQGPRIFTVDRRTYAALKAILPGVATVSEMIALRGNGVVYDEARGPYRPGKR